jgi:hypothetical protein
MKITIDTTNKTIELLEPISAVLLNYELEKELGIKLQEYTIIPNKVKTELIYERNPFWKPQEIHYRSPYHVPQIICVTDLRSDINPNPDPNYPDKFTPHA